MGRHPKMKPPQIDKTRLLPCPFCFETYFEIGGYLNGQYSDCHVSCENPECGCLLGAKGTEEEVTERMILKWNTRTPPLPDTVGEILRLVKLIEERTPAD